MRVAWLASKFDYYLFYWYCLFAFVALVFEPLYYFGCDWNGLTCRYAEISPVIYYTKEIWLIYAQWDPMFLDVPLWLRVLCSIEVFLFGPLYALTVYGLKTNAEWLYPLTLLFAGALVYSTIVYFIMEILEFLPGTNMAMVFLVNIPWTIVPILLVIRLLQKKVSENKKQH